MPATPYFADLVRETCHEGGTGPLTPTGALPGHRRFAGAVPAGVPFHYVIAGIAQPEQWETGLGRIDPGGRLVRDQIAASSQGGAPVAFAAGLKTLALTVGASWFDAKEAGLTALAETVAGAADAAASKQPLSTTHDVAAHGAPDDMLTLRRGDDWVNIPLSTIAYRDGAGRVEPGGSLGAVDGSAAAPSLGFASDPGSGLFRPAANMLGFTCGGTERMRLTADGKLGLGTAAPACLFDLAGGGAGGGATEALVRLRCPSDVANNAVELMFEPLGTGQSKTAIGARREGVSVHAALNFTAGGVLRLTIDPAGNVVPGADNGQAFGWSSARWSVIYAATGTINTSDLREKQWRGAARPAELEAARRIIGELGFYQWNEAIAKKGTDGARLHFGVRAQRIWSIMAEEGLVDPIDAAGRPGATPYAFLCWDENGEDGREIADRFGVRVDQLTLFLVAAQEARIAALEAAA